MHLLDGEIATRSILSPLELSVHCGKSAYLLLVLFDEDLFPSSQFVSYKQTSSAPSHAKTLFPLALTDNPANYRIELNIAAVPFGPATFTRMAVSSDEAPSVGTAPIILFNVDVDEGYDD